MSLIALQWIFDPQSAAAGLAMPLLDGAARSTQVGDFTAFFTCVGGFCLWGAWRSSPHWVLAAGLILLAAAVFRTLAWAVHGADFAVASISIEIVTATILIIAARQFAQ